MLSRLLREKRVYIFPVLLLVMLVIFSIAKVSGSSVGVFNYFLLGKDTKQPSLMLNQPRGVRSDEWEVNTPLTIAQVESGFPRLNENIGNGQDMSVVADVPYKDWSTLFKPHNWAFFVMPLENAFAFKWWFLACLLMLGCYLFCLVLLPKKYLLASLVSIFLFLSPFVQWWYQSITILPLAYGLLLAFMGLRILDSKLGRKKLAVYSAAFCYILACFLLVAYVPFVIPVGMGVGAFLGGQVINLLFAKTSRKVLLHRLLCLAVAGLIALAVLFLFVQTRSSAIHAITDSVYPGQRIETSGGFDLRIFASGPFNTQLQDDTKALKFPLNQSEASSFVYIFPFLLPVVIYLFLRAKDWRKLDWRIVTLYLLGAGFMVRLFVPFSEFFFDTIQLNRIPHTRLLIGFGLLNIMLMVLVFQKILAYKQSLHKVLVWGSAAFAFLWALVIGLIIKSSYPGFLGSNAKIVLISAVLGLVIFLILNKKLEFAMLLLVIFSVVSVARVNPLYRGLSPIVNSELSETISKIGDENGKWVVSEDVIFENVTIANGLKSLSGVYLYPQLEIWKQLEKSPDDQDIYNRFAHAFFTLEKVDPALHPAGAYFDPPATDGFRVHADPCYGFLQQQNVSYILTSRQLENFDCVKEVEKISYPALILRVYEIARL